jgi:hypothetical protein
MDVDGAQLADHPQRHAIGGIGSNPCRIQDQAEMTRALFYQRSAEDAVMWSVTVRTLLDLHTALYCSRTPAPF